MAESHIEGSTAVEAHGKHPNYVGIFLLLGALTAVEIGVATVLTRSPAKVPMLLMLSAMKGILVALYYMHLRFDSRIFSFFFAAAIFLLAIPFALIVMTTLHASPLSAEAQAPEVAVPTQAPVQSNAPPVTFTVTTTEFKFEPNALTVKPGQTVNINLKNTGTVQHTFVLKETNTKIVADPGNTVTASFKAPGAGTYTWLCDVPGHAEADMKGALTVQ